MKRKRTVLVWAAALMLLVACGGEEPSPDGDGPSGEITVLADSSLREALTELAAELQDLYPKANVEFEFVPSSEIDETVEGGEEPDAVALIGEVDRGLKSKLDRASVFARSRLAIYVATGNPKGIRGLEDLAREDIAVAVCDSSTSCGSAGGDAITAAGVVPAAPSTHAGGAAALKQLKAGTADAALLLQGDVPPGDTTVERVELNDQQAVIVTYSVARFRSTDNEPLARRFVSFALSGEGQEVLRSFGFGPP